MQDEKLVKQIEAVLNENPILAHTLERMPLTKSDYLAHIESISVSVAEGVETYTSAQVCNHVLSQNK